MRIVVNGQQAFSRAVLEALLERGEDVVAVYNVPTNPDAKPDPLTRAALAHGLPVHQPRSFKAPGLCEELKALKPDLCVMAFVTRFVPEAFLDVPTQGTFQFHPSLLPRHRGPSAINWAIIQGEVRTGVSVFWPDKGLDTGPILLQKEVEIAAEDTLGSLYFDKLFPLGVDAMLESVDLVREGKAPRVPQDESRATYESWCRKGDVRIDWQRPLAEVYNLVRGCDPRPGAWTTHEGGTLELYDAVKIAGPSGTPGAVMEVTAEGFAVAAPGGRILVRSVRPQGAGKIPASELVAKGGAAEGMRFT